MVQDTGERIIPEMMKPTNFMLLEHLARYSFALPYMQGRVLDIACGAGYGSHMMAKFRKKMIQELVAVDNDQDILEYAQKTYQHPLITYKQADAMDPELGDSLGSFDAIVSFETIEHVEDDIVFMQQLKKILRPGGTLVLSTPCAHVICVIIY